MLKFWNSATYITNAEGVQTSYTVYQDDELPHKFYIAPNRPSIARNDGRLSFSFRKYIFSQDRAQDDAERESRRKLGKGGGYLIFDVVLRVPDVSKEDIKKQIQDKYKVKLAKAKQADDDLAGSPNNADLKARALAARKNTDGVLSVEDIEIAPIPFQNGKVSLNISPTNNAAFVQSITALGKPSADGDNTASFSAELTVDGAIFFEKALSTDAGGAVQVMYELETWSRSSDTTVTASYHKENALKYTQTIEDHHGATIWSEGSYKNTITQDLQKNEVVDIDVKWGEGTYTDEQVTQIRKWAFDAVADAVKRQIVDILPPEEKGSLASGRGGKTEIIKNLSATSDFTQTYRENFAMRLTLNPQGTLPNVGSMKDPRDPKGETYYKWSDYCSAIYLDDPFFQSLRLGVSTDLEFSSVIKRLEVELWYQTKLQNGETRDNNTTLVFTKDNAGRQVWDPNGVDSQYEYQYTIYFANGSPFVSPRLKATTKELVVGTSTDGIFALDVISNGISPALIRQCLLTVQVVDPTTQKKGPSQLIILDKSQVQSKAQIAVGNTFSAPYNFEYTREYTLEPDGKKFSTEAKQSSGTQLLVSDPFSEYRSVTIRAPRLKDGDSIYLELSYVEANGYSRTSSLTLDSDNNSKRWQFGINDRASGVVTYKGSYDFADRPSQAIAPTTLSNGDFISITPGSSLDVTVDPSLVDWDAAGIQIAQVYLNYHDQSERIIFKKNALPQEPPTVSFDLVNGDKSFSYRIVYNIKKDTDKKTVELSKDGVTDTYFVLPDPE